MTIEELTKQFDNLPDDPNATDERGVFMRKRAGVELVKALDLFLRENGADPFHSQTSDSHEVWQARKLKRKVGIEVFGVRMEE